MVVFEKVGWLFIGEVVGGNCFYRHGEVAANHLRIEHGILRHMPFIELLRCQHRCVCMCFQRQMIRPAQLCHNALQVS
jgi:hypothetical protein